MSGIRSATKPRHKRQGPATDADKSLIQDIIAQTPGGLSNGQVNALAIVLQRSRAKTKELVEEAALKVAERAERYADIHMRVTEEALANGDAKSLEVAARASQWAMENINVDGVGVIEKAANKPAAPSVMIGIRVGGLNETPSEASKGIEVLEAKVDPE